MRKIKMSIDTQITIELIRELIKQHETERARIIKMKDYYKGLNHAIKNRQYKDQSKPSNRLYSGYASYITDNFVGYMLGQPIAYNSDNLELLEKLNENFMYNDEIDNNITLAQEQSIVGYAYELLYRDDLSNARFSHVNTEEMIVVYDNNLEERELFAIRYVDIDDGSKLVYIYDKANEYTYKVNDKDEYTLVDTDEHYFDDVPVCTYENNRQRIGDFEKVLSLIDAYDKSNSDTANDFEYFTDALLAVYGVVMDGKDENGNPLDFKNNRILNFADANSKAEYVIKNINDTALENYKNRLNRDILRFANVIDMSDENFASNLSGVALKFKLQGMENITSIKEAKFRKGLMKRIELLAAFLNLKTNTEYTYTEITPIFVRNIPSNEAETIEIAKGLVGTGLVSLNTLRSQIPFIENPQKEKELLEKEEQEMFDDYEFEENEEENEVIENE